MIFGLTQTDNPAHWPAPAQPEPTFNELFSAAAENVRIQTNDWDRREFRRAELTNQIFDALGPDPVAREVTQYATPDEAFAASEARMWERLSQMQPDPMSPSANLPQSRQELDQWLDQEARREFAENSQILSLSPSDGIGAAEMLGGLWAGFSSDTNVAMAPLGFGAGSVARIAIAEGILSGASEALTLPDQYRMSEVLGMEDPVAWKQIAAATGIGAVTGGVIAGTPRALRFATERYHSVRAAQQAADFEVLPPDTSISDAFSGVERATRDMQQGRPIEPAPQTLPPGAPANWLQIRNGIFAGESNGDYDALFGFSNRPNGAFADVKLTEMTVDEAIAFSAPSGQYGQWVNGQIGRVATPMGAYQVVGTTLRAAKDGLGLRGDEIMNEELQDQIGVWIYRNQGTGAWEGYAGPRDTFVPTSGDAPATNWTSRGYTSDGQVRYGDNERIDVEYVVVDASLLRQATGDLQRRDRSQARSADQITAIAAGLDPALLMPGPTADRGPPIIGNDLIIESGNGRVQAIRRAYELHPDRAAAYRTQIEQAGFTIPPGVSEPVLVARRTTPFTDPQRVDFIVKAQDGGTATMTAKERAQVGRGALTPSTMNLLDPAKPLRGPENAAFSKAYVAAYPKSQQGAFIADDTGLSAEGARAQRDAMFMYAWDDADLLDRFIEGQAGPLRSLLDALSDTSPHWAVLRSKIASGEVLPEMDVTNFVTDAVQIIAKARATVAKEGSTVRTVLDDLIANPDMFGNAIAPLTRDLIRLMAPEGKQIPSERISDFLIRYTQDAAAAGRTGDIFAVGPVDVLKRIDDAAFADLTVTGSPMPRREPTPPQLPNADQLAFFDQGTASPEVVAADRAALDEIAAPGADAMSRTYGDILNDDIDGNGDFKVQDVIDSVKSDEDMLAVLDICMMGGRR